MTRGSGVWPDDVRGRAAVALVLLALWSLWAATFCRFFPNERGYLGHDYAYFLPNLYDGSLWLSNNGPFSVPWFTPSFFGGGIGAHVNVQRSYFSLAQLATVFVDPLQSVWITVLAYAALGLIATYRLLRGPFATSRGAAMLGAAFFLFNGFYSHRMIIGHFGYRGVMALPFIALLCLRDLPAEASERRWRLALDIALSGVVMALLAMSDFASILVPGLLSVVAIACIHALARGPASSFWTRFLGAGAVGIALSLSKLTAVAYFMTNFSRRLYFPSGTDSLSTTTALVLRSLFVSPALDPHRCRSVTFLRANLDRHEWEFSVGPIALLLFGFVVWRSLAKRESRCGEIESSGSRTRLPLCGLCLIFAVPVILNTACWLRVALLGLLPALSSSSTFFRWFMLYIPPLCVLGGLAVDRAWPRPATRRVAVFVCLVVHVLWNAALDRSFYSEQTYDPGPIIAAYMSQSARASPIQIRSLTTLLDRRGRSGRVPHRNEAFLYGASELQCYDAVFGYDLELLPPNGLRPGWALDELDGQLNVVNPATYVWPEDNGPPGSRFSASDRASAARFLSYREFPFRMPLVQRIANAINLAAVAAVGALLVLCALRRPSRAV